MAVTVRLVTSELAAHYPQVWTLIEALSTGRAERKYPVVLDIIAFCQNFEEWVGLNCEMVQTVTGHRKPHQIPRTTSFGPDPSVSDGLEYLAEYARDFVSMMPENGREMLREMKVLHDLMLRFTTAYGIPRYLSSVRCQNCEQYSVLRYEHDYLCVNKECHHAWTRP